MIDRAKNLRRSAGGAFQVVILVVLAVLEGAAAAGAGSGSSGKASATVGVFGLPGGQYIVGRVGIGILAVASSRSSVAGRRTPSMRWTFRPTAAHASSPCLGQIGSIAKGASIGLIGALVMIAAIRFRPEEASGLDSPARRRSRPWHQSPIIADMTGFSAFTATSTSDAIHPHLAPCAHRLHRPVLTSTTSTASRAS